MQPEEQAEEKPKKDNLSNLRPTRLGKRLVLAFLVLASLVGVVGFFSYCQLNKLLTPLTRDIPLGLDEIQRTSHLDSLAQKMRLYDQILTESVQDYVKTGDRQHKYRYQEFEPRLGTVIREAIEKGDEEDKKVFSDVQQAKRAYVQMDIQCIRAVDQGQAAEAQTILESREYWEARRAYKQSLEPYAERRGKEHGQSLDAVAAKVDLIVNRTHSLVEQSIQTLLVLSFLAIILAVAMGLFVSRTILRPIQALQRGAEVIGKGDLFYRIQVRSRDEIGQLAEAFNEMTEKLKESYLRLEDKVRDKTRELEQKYEEEKDQKKKLEMSKAAMLNVLEDLEIAKAEILEEKAKDEAVLASIGDGMIATDPDGKIIMMNKQAEVMLGFKVKDSIGKDFGEVIPGYDEQEQPVQRSDSPIAICLAQGKKIAATAYYMRSDGTRFPSAITVSPIQQEGRTLGAIEIFRDVTKEKEVDRMKTEFISVVSHELRTPLTVIREGVSLVKDDVLGPTTEDQKSFLTVAMNDIDRLGRIINNLLDVSKIEAGKVELKRSYVNLTEISDGVLAAFATRAKNSGLELKKNYSAPVIEIYADGDKLIQVFTNLLSNALKFTEKGSVEISLSENSDQITCAVIDTGRGISKEDLRRVFSKFQQFGKGAVTGEKGTGLGLSIAKGIVNLHQGTIWVESEEGVGTKFIFTLPKMTPHQTFQEQLTRDLRAAVNGHASLLVMAFHLKGQAFEKPEPEALECLEEEIQKCGSSKSVRTLRDGATVFAILQSLSKAEGEIMAAQIEEGFVKASLKGKIKLSGPLGLKIVSYPEDGSTEDELMVHLKAA